MKKENLLCAEFISEKIDYSFGAIHGNIPLKKANSSNQEFLQRCEENSQKKFMTLFIDNIRLYQRPLKSYMYTHMENPDNYSTDISNDVITGNRNYKTNLIQQVSDEDLLQLCSRLNLNFVIFTGLEDTMIDDFIFQKIPDNVLGIYASNCISFGKKVHPIPFGLNPKLNKDLFINFINLNIAPTNLVYVNHSLGSNPIRPFINSFFETKRWAYVDDRNECSHSESHYSRYFNLIKQHKFMICPDGNAIGCECYRNWEVLYMRRVPIVKDSVYYREIFKGLPVLYVKSYFDVTEDLLIENDYLFQEALTFDMEKLNIEILYNKIINEHDNS
jgi:hypothetical protein